MNHENSEMHEKIVFKDESYKIQGVIFEVYREIGPGFLESVYQECLEIELAKHRIPFQSQADINIRYKEITLNQYFKADIICYDKIIIELKAVKQLDNIHRAQLFNYLKATGMKLGLLVNFCSYPKVTIERIVFEK